MRRPRKTPGNNPSPADQAGKGSRRDRTVQLGRKPGKGPRPKNGKGNGPRYPSKRHHPHKGGQPPFMPGQATHSETRPSLEGLEYLLKRSGISLEKKALTQLWAFHNLLRERNHDRDLTRLIGFETIVTKHYIDCLLVGQMHKLISPILDIGTGAGFPGIPLMIQNPRLQITLAEPRPRRVEFLNESIRKVGLSGATIFDHKVVSRSFSSPVQTVITRALETMDKTVMRTSACLVKGGELILMKGPSVDEELQETLKRFKNIFRLKADRSYSLPFTSHERRLIVLEKIADPLLPAADDKDSDPEESTFSDDIGE